MKEAVPKYGAAVKNSPAKDIDSYLADVPKDVRSVLEKLRRTIRAAAPGAVEKIGYGIPMFYLSGNLVSFAAFKEHCIFFPMSLVTMKALKEDLEPYDVAKGTIHFTADRPLPAALVKKIVKARVRENEERVRSRKTKKK